MKVARVSWGKAVLLSKKLAGMVRESGFRPDVIVLVLRGGAVPGRIMSDELLNYRLYSMRLEFYAAPGVTRRKPVVTQKLNVPVKGKKVLLVDDVADTGESLLLARKILLGKGARQVKIAALHFKPHSKLRPDFFVEQTSDWLVYPWEANETEEKLRKR